MAPPSGAFRGEVGGTPFPLHIMSRRERFHPKVVNFVFLLIKLVGLGFKHSPPDLEFRASDILTVIVLFQQLNLPKESVPLLPTKVLRQVLNSI